jgi:uncharacterized membrane protein HdeD (DUF308 family)
MNVFAKIFVAANRIFGAFTLLGGIYMLLLVGWYAVRGVPLADTTWIYVLIAIALIAVGWLYLRAPLTRKSKSSTSSDKTTS